MMETHGLNVESQNLVHIHGQLREQEVPGKVSERVGVNEGQKRDRREDGLPRHLHMNRFKSTMPVRGHYVVPLLLRYVILRFRALAEEDEEDDAPDQREGTVYVKHCLPSEGVQYHSWRQYGDDGADRRPGINNTEP